MSAVHLRRAHLCLRLRSAVAVRADAPAWLKRRAVASLPVGGAKGQLVQMLVGTPFAVLPSVLAQWLPFVRRTGHPVLSVADDLVIQALDRAASELDQPFDDVIWIVPPPSDGARVSAVLFGGRTPVGHLRITDQPMTDRPSPSVGRGARTGVEWPMVVGTWEQDGVVVELTDALDVVASRPTDLSMSELEALIADVHDALGPAPPGLVPAHGDLTPWNLRSVPGGRRVLFDWEHRRFAPRDYDLVRFLLATEDGPARFARLPVARRRAARPAGDALIALSDARCAARRVDELTDWKRHDIEMERAALFELLNLTGAQNEP